jgi:hypothetical protein
LLELLPLPARRKSDWIYGKLGIPELQTRERYETTMTHGRRDRIIKLIDEHQPKAVVTYGDANEWRHQLDANDSINGKASATRRGRTIIICTHHPEGARSNRHWDDIGRYIERSAGSLAQRL